MNSHPKAAPPMTRNAKGALGYHEHRTMAEVIADEARANTRDRERYDRERRSLRTLQPQV
jgi:hypothetical protein